MTAAGCIGRGVASPGRQNVGAVWSVSVTSSSFSNWEGCSPSWTACEQVLLCYRRDPKGYGQTAAVVVDVVAVADAVAVAAVAAVGGRHATHDSTRIFP